MTTNLPTEETEQKALFDWAAYQKCKYPELECMYHIPNEGKRSPQAGAKLKRMGLSPGVPDICLPVAHGGYSALYIELKRTKGGKLSDKQRAWLDRLNKWGCLAVRCDGWEQAKRVIKGYLSNQILNNKK